MCHRFSKWGTVILIMNQIRIPDQLNRNAAHIQAAKYKGKFTVTSSQRVYVRPIDLEIADTCVKLYGISMKEGVTAAWWQLFVRTSLICDVDDTCVELHER